MEHEGGSRPPDQDSYVSRIRSNTWCAHHEVALDAVFAYRYRFGALNWAPCPAGLGFKESVQPAFGLAFD